MQTITGMHQMSDWDLPGVARALDNAVTEECERLVNLVEDSPLLLVFLRQSGCTFCREAVADIAKTREEIEWSGTRIVLVHMGDRPGIEELLARYGLSSLDRICDASRSLYHAFGLKKGTWRQLFGFKVWVRGILAGVFGGHGLGRPKADPKQMPGVFFIDRGLIARAYRHRSAADRPCYAALCSRGDLHKEDF